MSNILLQTDECGVNSAQHPHTSNGQGAPNGARSVNSVAQSHDDNTSRIVITIADLIAQWNLKKTIVKGAVEYHGANPIGDGADEDGFWVRLDGSAFDRKSGRNYTQPEVARELAGVDPGEYEPCVEFRARNGRPAQPRQPQPRPKPKTEKPASAKPKLPKASFSWDRARVFDYTDENGNLVFQVGRCDAQGCEKSIRQRRRDDAGKWLPNLEGVIRGLYNLPDVINADEVIVAEGETCADEINADLKISGQYGSTVATTASGGGGNAHLTDCSPLAGKRVQIVPDAGKIGETYRDKILNAVADIAECRVIELPNRGEDGDYFEFKAAGGTLAQMLELIDLAPNPTNPTNPTNPNNRLTGHNARELLDTDFPEPRWIATGIIPEGLTIFGGHPKLGKSWAMLSLSVAVVCGGYVFGQIEVESGDVLYLAMEDTARRMKSRMLKQLAGERPRGLERLHIEYLWPRINEGGLEMLDKWLSEHPDARLVVIDTLQKIKPRRGGGGNVYESDSDDVGDLKSLSDKYAVAIICVHHLRKGDGDDPVEALSGSYGISGAADTLLILQRTRGQADATLFVTGRDVDETEHALKFDRDLAQWNLLGDAAEYKLTGERKAVVDALKTMGEAVTPTQLWERAAVGKNLNNLKQMLWSMSKTGDVQNDGGRYSVSPVSLVSPVSPVSPVSLKGRRAAKNSAASEPYTVAPIASDAQTGVDEFDID